MAQPIGYKDAILWMVLNDDTEWVGSDDPIMSVTACLVADIYGKTNEQVTVDLRKAVWKQKR